MTAVVLRIAVRLNSIRSSSSREWGLAERESRTSVESEPSLPGGHYLHLRRSTMLSRYSTPHQALFSKFYFLYAQGSSSAMSVFPYGKS